MSHMERVTIVISHSMMKGISAAIERGAFVTSRSHFIRAAQLWSAAPERHQPAVEAPGIADNGPIGVQAFQHSR